MKTSYLVASIVGACTSAALAAAPQPRQKAEPQVCSTLHVDYEEASKRMAMNEADGIGDNSAVRATKRQTENSTILAEAEVTLDLLKANGCTLPKSAPSGKRYYLSALQCQNDILAVKLSGTYSFPPSCDRSKWKPDTKPAN